MGKEQSNIVTFCLCHSINVSLAFMLKMIDNNPMKETRNENETAFRLILTCTSMCSCDQHVLYHSVQLCVPLTLMLKEHFENR